MRWPWCWFRHPPPPITAELEQSLSRAAQVRRRAELLLDRGEASPPNPLERGLLPPRKEPRNGVR
jgi:hypothetical protein